MDFYKGTDRPRRWKLTPIDFCGDIGVTSPARRFCRFFHPFKRCTKVDPAGCDYEAGATCDRMKRGFVEADYLGCLVIPPIWCPLADAPPDMEIP